jgi:hypothetical protein
MPRKSGPASTSGLAALEDLRTVLGIIERKREVRKRLRDEVGHCRAGLWYVEGPYARHRDAAMPGTLQESVRGIRKRRAVRELVERLAPPWFAYVPPQGDGDAQCTIAYLTNGGDWKLFDLENKVIWTQSICSGKLDRDARTLDRWSRFFRIPDWHTVEENDGQWRVERYMPGQTLVMCSPALRATAVRDLLEQYRGFAAVSAGPADPALTRAALATLQSVGAGTPVAQFIEAHAPALARLGDALPLLPAHGDLNGMNVFVCDGEAWVVDWDNSGAARPALYDMLYLFLHEAMLGRGDLLDAWLAGHYASEAAGVVGGCGIDLQANAAALLVQAYAIHFHAIHQAGKRDADRRNVERFCDAMHACWRDRH